MSFRIIGVPLTLLLTGVVGGCDPGADAVGRAADATVSVPLYDNLGDHHVQISVADPAAQRYFDQGIRLYYAFNHVEAIRAFEEAARIDPGCAMCYWGIALAHGPNINLPMDEENGAAAYAAMREAVERLSNASPKEQALIRALEARYVADPQEERAALDSAYAAAMARVVREFPEDDEAAVLRAEALMNLSPWHYWTGGGEPRPQTGEILASLERVIETNPNHPGACHLYIHAVEEVHPERAVPCAERLAGLMPGAGHLVHMPAHIYIRVGRYMDAIHSNEHAVHADESYIRDQRPGLGVYTAGYYPHNYDFLAFAASLAGRSGQAIESADRVRSLIPEELLRAPGMATLQLFASRPLQMRVRFGRWDEILASPAPDEDLPLARGLWHYARGRAQVGLGDVPAAAAELVELRAAAEHPELQGVQLDFNEATTILRIAADVLEGEIAAAEGDFDSAIAALTRAAGVEDELIYGEPPEWSVPVRHDLGAVLLAAGRPGDAEAVYRQDLRRFPDNGWSLAGLRESLQAQGRSDDVARVDREFEASWSHSDVRIAGSRY